jgi:hypothetical protein
MEGKQLSQMLDKNPKQKDRVSNFALNHHKKIPHDFQDFNPLKSWTW